MENETQEQEVAQNEQPSSLHQVTPLSKYLAMALFVTLPFLGGYVGYTYAPEKIIEVEKNIVKDGQVDVPESEKTEWSTASEIEDNLFTLIDDFSWKLTGVDEYNISWTVSPEAIGKYSAVDTAYVNFYLIPDGADPEYRNQNGVRQTIGDGFRVTATSYTFDSKPGWDLIFRDSYQVVGELSYQPRDFECDPTVTGECSPVYSEQDQLLIDQTSKYQFVSEPFLFE